MFTAVGRNVCIARLQCWTWQEKPCFWKGYGFHVVNRNEACRLLGHASMRFQIERPSFERMVSKFVSFSSGHLYKLPVLDVANEFHVKTIDESQAKFSKFSETLYAVDVTFQQSFRPSGSIQEGKLYLSSKHKLYGLKTEVSVLHNGLAVNCSTRFPGSVSYFEISSVALVIKNCF